MRKLSVLVLMLMLCIAGLGIGLASYSATINHYVYVFTPGNIYVYDMDNNFALIKNVPFAPTSGLGNDRTRGAIANAASGMMYISYVAGSGVCCGYGHMVKYDLIHDSIVWDVSYAAENDGTDSHSISPDGLKLYSPRGESAGGGLWRVLDTNTGSIITSIDSGGVGPHNTITTLNGTHVYLGPRYSGYLVEADAATGTILKKIGPTGNNTIRPFTIDNEETYSYITDTGKVGFYVGSIATGSLVYWVCPPGFCWTSGSFNNISGVSHGISLSPNEKELYLVDLPYNHVHVFDVTTLPSSAPVDVADIPLKCTLSAESWLEHSRDGRFVFVGDCGDVIDTSTRQVVANMPTMANTRIFQEVDFQNGVPIFSPLSRNQGGYGAQPSSVTLSNTSLSFGNQTTGTTSNAQTTTLTNNGSAALSISSIAVTGTDSGDFAETNTCGSSVAAGANCTISVTFTPTVAGTRTAAVTITDSDPSSPQTVTLTGTGVAPTTTATVTPSTLTFASQTVGTTSAAQTVTVSNTGSAALTISSISASGDFAETNTCGGSVAVGANCTVSITFTPTASGTRTGTLSITDNVSGSPQTVTLSGSATSNTADFSLSLSPSAGTVTAGQSATFTLGLTPTGGFNQAVNLSCSGAPQASTCSVSPGSVTLNGSSVSTTTVTVATTARGLGPLPGPQPIRPFMGRGVEVHQIVWLLVVLAMLASVLGSRQRRVRWVLGFAMLVVAFGTGCSTQVTSSGTPGTPAGTYTLTVTGTSGTGTSMLTHSNTLTITVN